MSAGAASESLTPEAASRLGEFARACKAATRVVAMYPATHPSIQASLSRVADAAEGLRAHEPAVLTVLPDRVLLQGRGPIKDDPALAELASLLHGHVIGELRIVDALTATQWHTFLGLLARPSEEIRGLGGIARACQSAGVSGVEVRQIDYTEVLRERSGALDARWDRIIDSYLEGEQSALDDEAMASLLEITQDSARFKDFVEQVVAKTSDETHGQSDIVLRILQALADFVARAHPEELDRVLHQVASAVPRLTPDLVLSLIAAGGGGDADAAGGIDLPGEVGARITDDTVAEFVAHAVSRDQGASNRLAQAFQALVPEAGRRERLLELAERDARNLPIGQQSGFTDLWKSAASLLANYSDAAYVPDDYARELSTARTHAIDVESVSDDPPERMQAWLATVADDAVRRLDHQMLLDLLVIESRPGAWAEVLDAAATATEQLVLTGHLDLAQHLLDAIEAAAADDAPFADEARRGLERLRTGPLVRHVILFIRQAAESDLDALSHFCRTLGPSVIGPLAEALATESGGAVRRLREVLFSFGAAGRAYATELRSSANPAVRRTAVELLRAFGGAEALPDLASLLGDSEPAVQREALRAIVQIGTDESYATLHRALLSSDASGRDAIMQALRASRDERAAPLFVYILDHGEPGAGFEPVRLSAIDALGRLGGDEASVAVLTRMLHDGQWWAPRRTSRRRQAAALALRACGSARAADALEDAARDGARPVRRAAAQALAAPASAPDRRQP